MASLTATGLLAGTLAGCATTQDRSARAQVVAERVLASQRPLLVRRANRRVAVLGAVLVRGRSETAVVVRLRNDAFAPATGLPLTVGIRSRGGRLVALNRRAGLPYFQTHAPAMRGGATATWVFTTHARLPHGALLVRVGAPARHPLTTASALPRIDVTATPATHAGRATATVSATNAPAPRSRHAPAAITVTVVNASSVPQYALEVYAWARRGRRVVAAGRVLLGHLGSNGRATVTIPLIGDPRGARVQLAAPPTLFA